MRKIRGNALLGPVFFIGILAGISIPAYQDYTIRSQVSEGLDVASVVKVAVAEAFATSGKWPRDLRELKFEQVPRGKYTMFAALNHGTVVIRYSSAANPLIARHQLTLRPTLSPEGNVVWSCGYTPEAGSDPSTGGAAPHATDIAPKYLPTVCRG